MQKPAYAIGAILEGYFGWIYTYSFYQVQGHTKGGAPRLVKLDTTRQVVSNTPAGSDYIVSPVLPEDGQISNGCPVTARWSSKNSRYQLKSGEGHIGLSAYDAHTDHHNRSYG